MTPEQKKDLDKKIIEDMLSKYAKYPFSSELKSFIRKNQDFARSLKMYNMHNYYCLPFIFTSGISDYPNDEVIGIWYVNRTGKNPKYKQDFIVKTEKEFISYTSKEYAKGEFVEPLDKFFEKYGKNGKYYHNGKRWQHHYKTLEDLPDARLQNLARKYEKTSADTIKE